MALETAYVSLIIFAGRARTLVPLTELLKFDVPEMPIGGGTGLGGALDLLMNEIEQGVQKTTYETKGDWKPVIFLLTDGASTDNPTVPINKWNGQFRKRANLIAVSIGNQADTSLLSKLTEYVLVLSDTEPKAFEKFFQWISTSIETKSMNIAMGKGEDFQLTEIDERILRQENESTMAKHDERFAILLARCRKTKKLYLMKYLKQSFNDYAAEGAFTISEEYFDLTPNGHQLTVNTESLDSVIPCPECNSVGFAQCVCGNLFCLDRPGEHFCPWCNQKDIYSIANFDVTRTQG